jgi:leucyl-tRNA---protein transferase
MHDAGPTFINEYFHAARVSPAQMDELLAGAWRHFGTYFFRYSIGIHGFDIRRVIPLRIRLRDHTFTKSQRRALRRNAALDVRISPLNITSQAELLFHKHKGRFKTGVPDSIFEFVSATVHDSPADTMQLSVYESGRLLAESYFDVGAAAMSGIYGMFDTDEAARGLGVFTLLKEIEFAAAAGKEFYYLGYSYEGESFYDYKKRFRATEAFDWSGNWEPFQREADDAPSDL